MAAENAAQFQFLIDHIADFIALFDANLRKVQWKNPFLDGIGIFPQPDMPLDTLLREQAAMGLFGLGPGTEAKIARRVGML